jgi:type II secretory pathway pseudopilin PulG
MFKLSTSAARDSRKIADVRALSMAIEQYFSDNSFTYPDLNGSTNDSQVRNALGAYFPSGTPPRPEGGGTYHVRSSADEKVYCIYAQLELARNHNCQGFQIGGSEYCEFTEVVQGAPRFCMTSTQN